MTLSGRAEYVDNCESELWRSWNLTAVPLLIQLPLQFLYDRLLKTLSGWAE